MRLPDEIVGHWSRPQTLRWVLFRCAWFQIVLNKHVRSDVPVLHDHEWDNATLVLRGRGREWIRVPAPLEYAPVDLAVHLRKVHSAPRRRLFPGRLIVRRADELHWIEIPKGAALWTLFITGPKVREFGYMRANGHWTRWDQSPDVDDLVRLRK